MPFIDDAPAAGLPLLSPAPLDITPPGQPFSRLFDTALRRDNIVGSITEAATQPPMGAFDPSFDPWAKIEGYEDHARSFIGTNNDEDVLHVKARIDKERRDEEALSTGGWRGTLAQLAAGTLDPTMLMPVGGEVRAITRGGRALEGLIRGGAAFGAGSALQETGLQASQITRPMSESLMNVGGATVLGGILGGAVGGLTRPTMQMLRDLGDSSAVAGAVFDRELAANLPGRRPIDVPTDVIDQPTVERAIAETFAAGGDTARVYEGIGARVRSELAQGAIVSHVDQGGERVPIVAIDKAGMLTDANQARLRIDEVTAPGHSIEIQPRPADMGPLVDDPLALLQRGVFTAARAAEIAGLPPEDVLRLRASGIPFDQEMWKVIADNLSKAEASREGGVGVVADQLGYLQARGASEREAVAVIARSMQLEAARGGDAAQLLEDAVRERWGDAPPAWVAGRKQQLLEAATPPGPLEGGIAGAEYRKLIAQGVPEEEARAEAVLTQKRAEARAARHGGLGTAEELYRRENPDVVFGEAGELREGELGQAPSETKGHPQGEVEDTAWRRLEPEVTSEGKYRGAPDWVTNRFKLFQMRRLIQKLIAEGTPGRFWYEDSARRIMQITHGNLAEAEKLMGLVAIYSPQTRVFGNMVFAIKAYDQWKAGLPISVKTGIQDAKAQAWLEHGTDWGLSESGDVSVRNSRKTNNFYLNLMHELVTEHPDAIAGLNIPSDVLTAIKGATVDLWVLRALGYRIDAAGGVGRGATTKYGFSEREIQRATGWLNKDLPEGARRWLPHQVQAALWSAIKARYELPEVKAATMAESLRRGFSRMLPDENGVLRQVHPTAAGPERQGHMEVWRKHALRALPADVARAVETAKGSFGDAIDRIAQNVTGEAVPTSALGHEINNASPAAKEQFTRDALALIIDDDGNDVLAAHLGVNLNYNHIGTGTYKGGINPVVTTRLVPTKPAGFFDATLARAYARAWQYIFKQDAVPFFRADVAAKFKGDFSVRNTETDAVRRFDTQEAAQAYADRLTAEGKTAMLTGGPFSRGFHLEFAQDIDEALQQRLLSALQEEVGPSAGFTKTGDREITVVNYRQGEQRLPPVDDERFGDAIERIAALDDIKADVSRFGSEGEYGPVHDWQAEPGGPDQGIAGGSPAFQSWVRDRAEAFDRLLDDWHDPESRIAAGEPRPGAEPGLGEPRAAGEPGAPRGPPGEPDTGGVRPGGGGRGGAASAAEAQRGAAQAAAGQPSLTGLPNKPVQIGNVWYVAGPLARAKDAALNYMRRAGLIYDPPKTYVTVDPERAARIAAAFEAMEHNPDDPRVRAAYEALAKETLAQWEAIKETGLKVEWIKPGQEDPYAVSPRLALMDIIDNNHWWGFPTDLGYGTADATARHNNPMLQLTGEVIDGREVVVNDIFRIVHDYFGHAKEGVGFRASGEENAWRAHAAMYSDEARGAMTTETRGQNSWVNYGPHAETNRTASAADTIYSPQKIGLLPDWVENEGRADALEQAGRGKIRLGTEQQRALITLYRNAADASTLLHENWHQWVNELFRDAATPDAPPQLVADAATLRRAVGAKEGEPLTREQQEQLAKWGEQYTREGKAPSPELEGVFARFKEWLTDIYQTIKDLGVPINDDVRGAFDRMLTVPEGERIAGEAPTAGAGGSVGAAKVLDTSLDQETIASALGVEKALVRSSPTLRAGTSPLIDTRRIAHELADQPLDLKKNVAGIPTAQSVESLIKQFKGPLAEAEVGVDDAFVRYRLGRARRPFDIARLEARDMFGRAQGAMSYGEFRQAISRAMRRGDQSTDPEVAAAAKLLREKVFDPLKERAIAAGLLPEDVDTKTALSYLMRVYNANKIVAQRGQFADVITRWLSSEQAKKDTIRTRIADLLDEHRELTSKVRKREAQIEGRERTLRDTEMRREEASRFNAFAYRRATDLSAPVDQLRTDIGAIEKQIAPHLERLEQLRTAIAAEMEKFPELREIDAAMYRLIGAGQKLREGGELVDLVRDSEAVAAAIQDVRASVRGGIRELSEQRTTARQALGAVDLEALEKARADIGKTIRPYRKELQRLQRQLKREMRSRGGPARGGAVFETAIRRRGNVLADQASGRAAAIGAIGERRTTDQARIAAIQTELEGLVKSWEGATSQRAKAALARRAEAEATRTPEDARLRSADKPVIKAAKAMARSNTRLEEIELRDIARQIIDRILGSPVGRLPYDMEMPAPRGGPPAPDRAAPRGPLAGRAFMIPDELIEPWLENDSRQIARSYSRTMAPDVLLAERFGRTDMEAQFQQIQAGYERLRVGKSEAEQKKLHAAMQADLRDLGAMRDRLRGTYGLPENPNGLGNRVYHVIRDLNYLRLLGGMTVSAFPDMGRLVMVHGFNRVFGDALLPMLKSFHQYQMAAKEAKLAGTALDMVLDTRAMSMADMLDDYGRWTNYERGLKGLTDKFGLVTLMAPWNAAVKQIAGVIGQTRTLEVIEDLVAGRAVRPAERTRLASLGIGPDMAERIDAMFKAHGVKQENGTWWANTEAWTDQSATEAFRSALNKEIDTTIVTQGQEIPLWMSRGVGRLIGQFRSFNVSSAQRVMMSGLQKRDMATLNGAVMMIGLGMLVYTLRTLANPKAQPLPDPSTPGGAARWMREGLDISGLTGWLFDAHNMIEKATGGGIGLSRLTGGPGQSRYMNYNTLDALLGPTAGLVEDAARLTGEAAKGTWSAGDSSRVRRMIPFQNLIGFRHLFDAAEHGLNHSLGVREQAPRPMVQ